MLFWFWWNLSLKTTTGRKILNWQFVGFKGYSGLVRYIIGTKSTLFYFMILKVSFVAVYVSSPFPFPNTVYLYLISIFLNNLSPYLSYPIVSLQEQVFDFVNLLYGLFYVSLISSLISSFFFWRGGLLRCSFSNCLSDA